MGKIIITGPGRAGSSFLVQLLTRLGFNTGYEVGREHYVPEIRAGCEWRIGWHWNEDSPEKIRRIIGAAPRVLKSPEWGLTLKRLLMEELIEVDHVLIPFRDLDVSARSRLDVKLDWMVAPELYGEDRVQDQAQILAMAFGRALEACLLYSLPCKVMVFPLFVKNADYCYRKIKDLGVERESFDREFAKLARPEQVKWG